MADQQKGKLLRGQQFERATGFIVPFTQQSVNHDDDGATALGDANTEVIPTDAASSEVRVYTPPDDIDTVVISYPAKTDLSAKLPNVLTAVTILYGSAQGSGNHEENGDAFVIGTSGTLNLNLTARSQGSASVIPDAQPTITSKLYNHVSATRHLFYMAEGSTHAQILTRLGTITGATVNDLPKFDPRPVTLTLVGSSASLSAEANAQQTITFGSTGSSAYSIGEGYSQEKGVTVRSVQLPPTIHGEITVNNATSATFNANASAVAEWTGGTSFPARSATSTPASIEVIGFCLPSTIPATTVTSIPSSGLYLVDLVSEPAEWDRVRIRAEVVDFSTI